MINYKVNVGTKCFGSFKSIERALSRAEQHTKNNPTTVVTVEKTEIIWRNEASQQLLDLVNKIKRSDDESA